MSRATGFDRRSSCVAKIDPNGSRGQHWEWPEMIVGGARKNGWIKQTKERPIQGGPRKKPWLVRIIP